MYQFNRPDMDRIWLENYGHIPPNLDYPNESMAKMMLDNCDRFAKYQAIKYVQSILSHEENFDEFGAYIEQTAKMLKLNGVSKNDRVIIMLPYLPELYHSIYATLALGAVFIPLHPHESKGHKRMAEIIKEIKPSTIICFDSCVKDLNHILANDKAADTFVKRLLYVTPISSLKKEKPSIINPIAELKYFFSEKSPHNILPLSLTSPKVASFAAEMKEAKNYHGGIMANVDGNDEAAILLTSGTSGKKPDACVHTHNAFNSLAISGYHICDCIEPGQKLIVVPGAFHCFGLETATHTLLNSGVTQIVIPDPKDLGNMAETQKREQAEIQIHVPLLLTKMKASGKFDNISYKNTKLFIVGGSTMGKNTYEYWDEKLPDDVHPREGYGNTQTLGGTCINLKHINKYGSIGVPLPDYYYKLIDPTTGDEITEPYNTGEIYISGPSVMKRIIGDPNPECLFTDANGVVWYKTNDLAFFDETGFFTFADRKDDLLNMFGGNLVSPSSIRNVLAEFGIEESVIFRVVDEENELDKIIACIEYNADIETLDELKKALMVVLKQHLKNYEMPNEIVIFEKFPLSLAGKAKKNEITESYQNGEYSHKLTLR